MTEHSTHRREAPTSSTTRTVADPPAIDPERSSAQLVWRPDEGGNVTVVARARSWLQQALPKLIGRSPRGHLQDDTELLLSELVTNAVTHAGGVIAVSLRVVGKTLRITVCDHATASPVVRNAAPDAEHGRGYALIETLATRWGVDRSRRTAGKCVWLELSMAAA